MSSRHFLVHALLSLLLLFGSGTNSHAAPPLQDGSQIAEAPQDPAGRSAAARPARGKAQEPARQPPTAKAAKRHKKKASAGACVPCNQQDRTACGNLPSLCMMRSVGVYCCAKGG